MRRRLKQQLPRSKKGYGFEMARSEKSGRAFLFWGLMRPRKDKALWEYFYTCLGPFTYTLRCVTLVVEA
jgi:hypothetical protein